MGLFGAVIRYGLPLSFLHCTIYQQNIWREGEARLLDEQKQSFMKLFGLVDTIIAKSANTLNVTYDDKISGKLLVSKVENLDFKNCWNNKVRKVFSTVDLLVNKPSYAVCLLYRKVKPYVENPHKTQNAT